MNVYVADNGESAPGHRHMPSLAVDSGLTLLRLLAERRSLTFSQAAHLTGMPIPIAFRILSTMQQQGIVEFNERPQEWQVRLKSDCVSSALLLAADLANIARHNMNELAKNTGQTSSLAVADRGKVVLISQVNASSAVRAFLSQGARNHIHASALGKALLAEMPNKSIEAILHERGLPQFTGRTLVKPAVLLKDLRATRARGWAIDNEEVFSGLKCIAAPIFNSAGNVIASVSVSGRATRFPGDSIVQLAGAVQHAASEITTNLGNSEMTSK